MVFANGLPIAVLWLIAMVAFLVLEAAVPGLVSIWFALGALAAVLAAMLHAQVWLQVVWFFAVSIAALWFTRPLVKKYVNARVQPTNADALIGKECLVTEDINNIRAQGAVKAGGKIWTARAEKDEAHYSAGAVVTVVAIDGVKLIVK